MNNSPRRPGFLIRLGFLIVICATAGLSGCTSTVKLNYVNWEVEFTKGTSELDKAIAMDSVRRYILHHLSAQEYTGYILTRVTFNSHVPDHDRAPIGVELRFGAASQTAVPPPKPGGGPGKFTFPQPPGIPSIPNIIHIENVGKYSSDWTLFKDGR
jgi:hypothetical protein